MSMALKHWEGVLSPKPFMLRSRSAFSGSEMAYAPVSLVLSASYASSFGGSSMMSIAYSAVLLSSIVRTWANLVLSAVMLLRRNWASAWANQRTALSGQNGGNFTETTATFASAAKRASSRAFTRSSMMSFAVFLSLGVTNCRV